MALRVGRFCIVWVAGLVAATACANTASSSYSPQAATPAGAQDSTAVAASTAAPIATRIPPVRTPITSTGPITLTLWTTEDFAPGTTTSDRLLLRNQFDAFTAANANIHIEPVLKKAYGKGGLLDFLTTTSAVVPNQLPDLATLDMIEVPQAASAGILQPLDSLLSPDLEKDLFPFASQAGHYQAKWVAVPFTADVEHLVYNKAAVRRAPQTWDDVLKQKGTLILPLGGDDGFVTQYLGAAPLFDANSQLTIDPDAATQVLSFFKRAHDLGILQDAAIGFKSSDEAWPTFVAGKVSMVQALASRYLADRNKLPDAMYATLPTRDGKAATIASGWTFVIITTDPARQVAAARFIQWIVQGEHLAPWLRAARRLPASRATMILAVDPVDYGVFLQDQMERAVYLPPSPAYDNAAEAWRAAVAAVWKGQTTPDEGARAIAAALK